MAEFDLVVRNAVLATVADVTRCDIGIREGRIVAVAERLGPGAQELDAAGRIVTPGGVDGHCHLDQPASDGSVCADDFHTGTRSAACGGTTTVLPFALQAKGQSLLDVVEDYHRRADGKAVVDYAFHLIVSDPTERVLTDELPALIHEGYTSFKVYMTYDDLKLNDRQMLEVLAVARRNGATVMVHAENADCIGWLTDVLEAAGHTAPRYHATARPMAVEREATHRAITLAEIVDVPILLVHVSGREAMEQIRWAQGRGLRIFAETCPQYLFLEEDDLAQPGFEGAKLLCSPPPRDRANQQAIWDGLRNGTFHIFSSDHAPTRYDDPRGKKVRGEDAAFRWVPNGVPGLETRLPLLFSGGVQSGRISLPRFVELTATNPARLYGLYPRKGSAAVGADADLVIWDTETPRRITNDDLHHNVDYTPYEGEEVRAWPAVTLSRGRIVWQDGRPAGEPGSGQFLRCGSSEMVAPSGQARQS